MGATMHMVTSRENKAISVYSSMDTDGMKAEGQYIGNASPPGFTHHVILGFRPKYLVINDQLNGIQAVVIDESSGTFPPPPAPADAINTAGMIYSIAAPPLPANIGVMFAPDGFYVDAMMNTGAVAYDYTAIRV